MNHSKILQYISHQAQQLCKPHARLRKIRMNNMIWWTKKWLNLDFNLQFPLLFFFCEIAKNVLIAD